MQLQLFRFNWIFPEASDKYAVFLLKLRVEMVFVVKCFDLMNYLTKQPSYSSNSSIPQHTTHKHTLIELNEWVEI